MCRLGAVVGVTPVSDVAVSRKLLSLQIGTAGLKVI
jgi:hypothetical protein